MRTDPEFVNNLQDTTKHDIDFDFGDAFSDDGDDGKFEFTSAALREEMSKSFSNEVEQGNDDDNTFTNIILEEPDASVSTFDLNAPTPSDDMSVTRSVTGSQQSISLSSLNIAEGSPSQHVAVTIDMTASPPSQFIDHNTVAPTSKLSPQRKLPHDSSSAPPPLSSPPQSPPVDDVDPNLSSSLPVSSHMPVPNMHRQTRSVGPSALEKVMSKTRPSFLPPKNKKEDNRHLSDWQNMMKRSRILGRARSEETFTCSWN